jgi:hypothetical protein
VQLPSRDPDGRVPVRRLWPGALRDENPEAGTIIRVPAGLAIRMVLAGEVLPAFADDGAGPAAGSLVEVIRSALRNDAELYGLLVGARAYAFHGAGPEMAAQRRAGERLRRIIGGLPRALRPASYSAEGFEQAFGVEPADGWYAAPEALPFRDRDRKAELLAHHCRRRRLQLLVRFFDSLRNGQATARGQLPCGLSIDVPSEIWAATNVVVDLVTGAVTSDRSPLFDHVEVARRGPATLGVAA